jgi:ubiquinone/menaquinone biosynthesis C-methylase UbiE
MKNKEIKHYDNEYLWKKLELSQSNRERIQQSVEIIPQDVNSVADIGCGSGLFLNQIKEQFPIEDLVGIDFSVKAMRGLKVTKMVGDITDIPLESNSYDLVSALEVIEHLDPKEYEKARKELARVSRKYILISVPFNEDLELELVECCKCKTRFNKSHHKRTFRERTMYGLFEKDNYQVKSLKYISKRNQYFLISPLVKIWRKKKRIKNSEGSICPVCGYEVKEEKKQSEREKTVKKNSGFLEVFKRIWPKGYTYKWILVLYERENK